MNNSAKFPNDNTWEKTKTKTMVKQVNFAGFPNGVLHLQKLLVGNQI